jgi:hypothetical protein
MWLLLLLLSQVHGKAEEDREIESERASERHLMRCQEGQNKRNLFVRGLNSLSCQDFDVGLFSSLLQQATLLCRKTNTSKLYRQIGKKWETRPSSTLAAIHRPPVVSRFLFLPFQRILFIL